MEKRETLISSGFDTDVSKFMSLLIEVGLALPMHWLSF